MVSRIIGRQLAENTITFGGLTQQLTINSEQLLPMRNTKAFPCLVTFA